MNELQISVFGGAYATFQQLLGLLSRLPTLCEQRGLTRRGGPRGILKPDGRSSSLPQRIHSVRIHWSTSIQPRREIVSILENLQNYIGIVDVAGAHCMTHGFDPPI